MTDKYIIPFLVSVGSYFAPTKDFIILVGFLIVIDMVTALIACRKVKEPITSAKLSRTIGKFLVYGCAIITSHVITKYFFPDFPALQLMAGFITFVELKSIDENIKKYTGYSMFGSILEKLKPKK